MSQHFKLVKVKDPSTFRNVFGADCFIEYFPKIQTTGILVWKKGEKYYVLNDDLKVAGDTAFFSEDELRYLEIIKEVDV